MRKRLFCLIISVITALSLNGCGKTDKLDEYYENNEADYATFEVAKENYDRAFLRIEYISTILQGEIPEGDNIEVIEEESTDFDPVTADE